jgi:hypothetical protein
MKICYWSIAWGEYSYILQSLLKSYNDVGLKNDFHVYSDKKLKYCINHELNKSIELDKLQFFKFNYLKKELSKLNYDIFVFIDADHFFVRKPEIKIEDILGEDNWHSFLESPVNSYRTQRQDWWGIPNYHLVKYFKELGVKTEEIRNTNGGYWICRKNFINSACDLAFNCHEYLKSNFFIVPEEVSVGYISHMVSKNQEKRYAENYLDYWASDWTSNFGNILPENRPWIWTSYMTNERFKVNPSLVHAMRSKNALIKFGKNILTEI